MKKSRYDCTRTAPEWFQRFVISFVYAHADQSLFLQVWFKNKRAKCRQQDKQSGVQTKPYPVKRKNPSPPLQDPVKPAKRNMQISPPQPVNKFNYSTAASWPQQNTNILEQNMQALVNIQRNTGYQPSSAVNNSMVGPSPTSLQAQFHSIHKPDFPAYAKNIPMGSWISINHNIQPSYFTPSMI